MTTNGAVSHSQPVWKNSRVVGSTVYATYAAIVARPVSASDTFKLVLEYASSDARCLAAVSSCSSCRRFPNPRNSARAAQLHAII